MPKAYRCADCKVIRALKWTGRCPGCHGFFNIQITSADDGRERSEPVTEGQVVSLDEVVESSLERVSTGIDGLDLILGRDPVEDTRGLAIKAGHIVQIYGEPGAGKSTLITQACQGLTKQRYKVLYIAGEESLEQIKTRTSRVGKFNSKFRLVKETDLDVLLDIIDEEEPEIVVIDSVNMVEVDEYDIGSMAAVKIATKEFIKQAKKYGFGLIIVVQITKGGDFSGPKALEHQVDTSLYLRHGFSGQRVLECKEKNRYGNTPAYAYFQMSATGLTEYQLPEEEDEQPKKKKKSTKKVAEPVKESTSEPHLKSVPADGEHTPTSEIVIPKNAKEVLAIPCDNCDAPIGKACTADSGAREAGFHQSRVMKSTIKILKPKKKKKPPPTSEPRP